MSTTSPSEAREALESARRTLRVAIPDAGSRLDQHEEWFLYDSGDGWRELRVHEYADIFEIQGLYERVVNDAFECVSPDVVAGELMYAAHEAEQSPRDLVVLDLGAGNGCVGEALALRGFDELVGVDIFPEAAEAAERDRPGIYADYAVGDLLDLPPQHLRKLDQRDFNAMTCVAALGYGDIPPAVFAAAFNRVENGGWIAFTIKSDFLDTRDRSGFATLIGRLLEDGTLEAVIQRPYRHRYAIDRTPIEYTAIVGRKRGAIELGHLDLDD